jgi:hypothetical protein
MSCCGQKRQTWRVQGIIKEQARTPSPPILQNPSVLYHLGDSSLVIKGMVTGYTYLFAGQGTGLSVDERDLQAFLTMEFFELAVPEI